MARVRGRFFQQLLVEAAETHEDVAEGLLWLVTLRIVVARVLTQITRIAQLKHGTVRPLCISQASRCLSL